VSTAHILLLGAIAGATIFLGLPVGRMQGLGSPMRAGLSALATGILVFLLWDVLSGAVEPIESALDARQPAVRPTSHRRRALPGKGSGSQRSVTARR